MNSSYLARLRAFPHGLIFDLRWKLGLFKKTNPTGGGAVTYLPDGQLCFIPSQGKARNADTKPPGIAEDGEQHTAHELWNRGNRKPQKQQSPE